MKRDLCGLIIAYFASCAAMAQNNPAAVSPSGPMVAIPLPSQIISDRGPHWQTVQDILPYQDGQGNWLFQTNTYVHLEPGLNYRTSGGIWTNAVAEFDLVAQGAVASRGQHQVTLPANLNSSQPVTLVQPDGKTITSRPHGLAYFDASTGEAVLVA